MENLSRVQNSSVQGFVERIVFVKSYFTKDTPATGLTLCSGVHLHLPLPVDVQPAGLGGVGQVSAIPVQQTSRVSQVQTTAD